MPDGFIDLIYCDILYGTGQDFGDYKDIKADRKIVNEFYIPRFQEMHRVLKEMGSIYLQMDTKINHWIRLILDDIFGYDNFRNEISWCYISGGISQKYFAKKHDVILFYSKSSNYNFNIQKENRKQLNKYDGIDKKGKFIWYIRPDTNNKVPSGVKSYLNSYCTDYWNIPMVNSMSKSRKINYQTQKPKELLERIIKASSNKNNIVADFFCGSGTTMAVAKDLSRDYIGCDISEKAVKITNERLNKIKVRPYL